MTLIVLIVNYVLGLVRLSREPSRCGLDQCCDMPRLAPVVVTPVARRALTPPFGVPPNPMYLHARNGPPGGSDYRCG
jgi:hypothetical protein